MPKHLPALLFACLLAVAGAVTRTASAADEAAAGSERAVAIFAGGCFWCMEPPFDALDGVLSTTSGYTGGDVANPTYEQVSAGRTGHAEAVRVEYDPRRVSYEKLLAVFWHNIDPTAENRQFCDIGSQYRSAVFYVDERQRELAEASKRKLEAEVFHEALKTQIVRAGPFYPAETYHQDYYLKNPVRYHFYRASCGRDVRLRRVWGELAK